MAFMGMVFVFLGVIIFGLLLPGGLSLVIFNAKKIKKHRELGENILTGEIIGTVIGAVMLIIPVSSGIFIVLQMVRAFFLFYK